MREHIFWKSSSLGDSGLKSRVGMWAMLGVGSVDFYGLKVGDV